MQGLSIGGVLRFMFDDDGHIWHSSGQCLGVNGDKLKKGACASAE